MPMAGRRSSTAGPPAPARPVQIDPAVLRRSVASFGGDVFVHAPADRPFDLGALDRPDDEHDRWSAPGTRTAYLAGDPLVAIAEYARHAGADDGPPRDERRLVQLRLEPVRALDLREPAVLAAVGTCCPTDFTDRGLARRVALAIRSDGICEALVVPSIAFVDQSERFNVVLFLEAIEARQAGLDAILGEASEVGRIVLGS
jgi:RES domain-containing protein